jgi:hypothetical protein
MLNKRGVPAKVIQRLMRHADISTTMNTYVHLEVEDRRAALDSLPSVAIEKEAEALRGTGTDDRPDKWTREWTRTPVHKPHNVAQRGTSAGESGIVVNGHETTDTSGFAHPMRERGVVRLAAGSSNRILPLSRLLLQCLCRN